VRILIPYDSIFLCFVLLTKFIILSINWAGKIEKSYIRWIGFRHLVWFREFKGIDVILIRGVHNNTGPNPTRGISIIKKIHTLVLTGNTSGKTVKNFLIEFLLLKQLYKHDRLYKFPCLKTDDLSYTHPHPSFLTEGEITTYFKQKNRALRVEPNTNLSEKNLLN